MATVAALVATLTATMVAATPLAPTHAAGGEDVAADLSVADVLAEIPVDGVEHDSFQISMANLDSASQVAGLERPDVTGTPDDVIGWIGPLSGFAPSGDTVAPVFVLFAETFNVNRLRDIGEFADELGWSLLNVDEFVEWSAPPGRFAVVTGDYDDITPNPQLTETEPGIFTAGKGDDFSPHLAGRTVARPLGRPLHMSVDGDHMAVSLSTPMIQAWDAGTGPTLADDESLALIAAALDDADVVSALLAYGSFEFHGMFPDLPPEAVEQIAALMVLDPFDTVGIGWTAEGGQPVVTVAYDFQTEAAASRMVGPVTSLYTDGTSLVSNTPFSEWWSLDDVTTNGRVVTVRLLPVDNQRASLPFRLLYQRDLPFVYR